MVSWLFGRLVVGSVEREREKRRRKKKPTPRVWWKDSRILFIGKTPMSTVTVKRSECRSEW